MKRFLVVSCLLLFGTSPVLAQYELHSLFPTVKPFKQPLAIVTPPDSSGRLFVVEQGGLIYMVSHTDTGVVKKVFLDLSDRVTKDHGEDGLLSLAFHPKFKENGLVFVSFTERDTGIFYLKICRYSVDSVNRDTVRAETERQIFIYDPPDTHHHGGTLIFGPQGNLFCGIGDCSPTGFDSLGNLLGDIYRLGQNMRTPAGKILRFDIDHSDSVHSYIIPKDNPFASDTTKIFKGIYATGFRNPWKYSFDEATGNLWVADVGQVAYEEINLVTPGGNYGWSLLEGRQRYNDTTADTSGLIPPIFEYPHEDNNNCITGGYVYHGKFFPELQDKYIYADFISGRIWALKYLSSGLVTNKLIYDHASPSIMISSFGRDSSGELLIADYISGKIYRLEPPFGDVPEMPNTIVTEFKINRTVFDAAQLQAMVDIKIKHPSEVKITLFDIHGREVGLLLNTTLPAGDNVLPITLDKNLPSGSYFLRLVTDEGKFSQKIVLR